MTWKTLIGTWLLLLLLLLGVIGCGNESATNPDQQRDIAGVWLVASDPFHSFEFITESGAVPETNFQGEENFGGEFSPLTGQMDGSQVSLVVDRLQGADPVEFFGIFTDDDTIHINSDGESYILNRQGDG